MSAELECPICSGQRFIDFRGRTAVQCASCHSLERHRILALVMQKEVIPKDATVLLLSPEKTTLMLLQQRGISAVTTADLYPEKYKALDPECKRIDLSSVDSGSWPDGIYDLIIHNHVLEHVPATLAYPIFHLFRMMKDSGLQVFSVPISSGHGSEDFGDLSDELRQQRFGQADHMRRFGRDDLMKTLGAIIQVEEPNLVADFPEEYLRKSAIPQHYWAGYSSAAAITLRKKDYLLRTTW